MLVIRDVDDKFIYRPLPMEQTQEGEEGEERKTETNDVRWMEFILCQSLTHIIYIRSDSYSAAVPAFSDLAFHTFEQIFNRIPWNLFLRKRDAQRHLLCNLCVCCSANKMLSVCQIALITVEEEDKYGCAVAKALGKPCTVDLVLWLIWSRSRVINTQKNIFFLVLVIVDKIIYCDLCWIYWERSSIRHFFVKNSGERKIKSENTWKM